MTGSQDTLSDLQKKLEEQNAQLEREIAARVRAEAERDAAHELLQAAIDGVDNPVMLIGADYQVRLANQAARDGYFPGEEREPLHCYQVFHHRDTPCGGLEHPCPLDEVRESLRPVTMMHQHTRQDGEKRFVEISASPLLGQDGTLTGIVESVRDVTKRVQTETQRDATLEALRESEEKFAKAFHSNPDLMAITRLTDGHMVAVNDSFTHVLGYSRKELVGRSTVELGLWVEPGERSRFAKSLQEHKRVRDFEIQVRTKSGEIRQMLFAGDIIVLNHAPHLITVASDVTERVRAEAQRDATLEALRESEERFALFMEHLPGVAFISDPGGFMIYANQRLCEVYGLEAGELLGRKFDQFAPPDMAARFVEQDQMVLSEGRTLEIEETVLDQSDPRQWLTYKFPLYRQGQPTLVGGVAIDITERVQAEQALRQAHDELESRVIERTAELVAVNQRLRDEIAERARVLEALHASEEKMRAQYKGIPVPTYTWKRVCDDHGKDFVLVDYNDAAVAITQGGIAGVVGVKVSELYGDNPRIQEEMWQCFAEKVSIEREMHYQHKITDKESYLAVKYAFVPPDLVLVHTEDITERVRAEKELKQHRDRLEELVQARTAELQREIAERVRAEDLIRAQRDLGLALGTASALDEGLRLCVEAALHISGLDGGGVYLVDEASGDLDLTWHTGLSPDFVNAISYMDADSPRARLAMAGKPVYTEHLMLKIPLGEIERREGLRAIAVIPIHHEGRVIGCLNITSHTLDEVPVFARDAIETIVAQIGSSIARLRAESQRDAMLEALRESEEKWRALVENAPGRITSLDRDGTILSINRTTTGYTPGEIIGTSVYNYLSPDEQDKLRRVLESVFQSGKVERYEAVVAGVDGAQVWYENSLAPIKHDGQIVAAIVIAIDITERVRAAERIQAALAEKVVLLREVHHRVKNNLQVLIYLIDMQAETVENPAALWAFGALRGRVRAMSLVHEKLYQARDLAQVDFGDYLEDLTVNLLHALGGGRAIALHVDAAGLSIDVNVAIPCGLMVNELVTNALKHAFPAPPFSPPSAGGTTEGQGGPEIWVEFGLQEGEYVLVVSDNGVGLPPGLDWRAVESLGLKMVNVWATHQLGGSIELGSGRGQRAGAAFEIRFPEQR